MKNTEGRILDAIGECEKRMVKVLSINVPKKLKDEMLDELIKSTGKRPKPGLDLITLFGITVKDGEELSLTIKI